MPRLDKIGSITDLNRHVLEFAEDLKDMPQFFEVSDLNLVLENKITGVKVWIGNSVSSRGFYNCDLKDQMLTKTDREVLEACKHAFIDYQKTSEINIKQELLAYLS